MPTRSADEVIEEVLTYLSPHNYDEWIRVGMGIKSTFGERGFSWWNEWSKQYEGYSEREAAGKWHSFKLGGTLRLGSLVVMAKKYGYNPRPDRINMPPPIRTANPTPRKQEIPQEELTAAADAITKKVTYGKHPYFEKKGLPYHGMLHSPSDVGCSDCAVIPIRHFDSGLLLAVQLIDANGGKKFYPRHCRVSRGVYKITGHKRPRQTWWCEGYATALAIKEALKEIGRTQDQIVVAFTAGNLKVTAKGKWGVVVADNDFYVCQCSKKSPEKGVCDNCGKDDRWREPAGEVAALATGLPWFTVGEKGMDAADCYTQGGDYMDELIERLMQYERVRSK